MIIEQVRVDKHKIHTKAPIVSRSENSKSFVRDKMLRNIDLHKGDIMKYRFGQKLSEFISIYTKKKKPKKKISKTPIKSPLFMTAGPAFHNKTALRIIKISLLSTVPAGQRRDRPPKISRVFEAHLEIKKKKKISKKFQKIRKKIAKNSTKKFRF
jgi:hypothetical protein